MIGQTISHYRILHKLGEGGMGVVYKAQDTKLDRFVALKFLPHQLTANEAEQARFLQEARAASALNHPNICGIHSIGEDGDRQFIEMEYVDGKTLRDLIVNGQLSIANSIGYAIQIGDALQEAHSKGIVHRDVKADNIMVNSKNQIKMMDFGLAKLKGSLKLTKTSSTVGTLAYMAPEQIQGGEVDARSDIFSFGVVLFEMLSGHLPFRGEHEAAMMYSIVNEEALPLQQFVPEASSELVHVVTTALEKNAEERYQSASEMVRDLRRAQKQTSRVSREILTDVDHSKDAHRPSSIAELSHSWRFRWIGAGIVLLLVAGSYFIFFGPRLTETAGTPPRVEPFTSYPGLEYSPAFSPDGKSIAFVWNGEKQDNFDIYVKQVDVDAGSPLRLTSSPDEDMCPSWSPDGKYIAFLRRTRSNLAVYTVPALTGTEQKIAEFSFNPWGAWLNWSPDGKTIAVSRQDTIMAPWITVLLNKETGDTRTLTYPAKTSKGDVSPVFSPDGKRLAFTRMTGWDNMDLFVVPVAGGEPTQVTKDSMRIFGLAWTRDGHELVFSSNRGGEPSLWSVSVDGGRIKQFSIQGEGLSDITIAHQGERLAYTKLFANSSIWRLDLSMKPPKLKPETPLISSSRDQLGAQYSPDGKEIVFFSNQGGNYEIWKSKSDGSGAVPLTSFGGPVNGTPRWSPDGHLIAFDSRKGGIALNIYVVNSDGGIPKKLTFSSAFENNQPSWSHDGRWIYFSSNRTGRIEIWKVPADGGEEQQVTRHGGIAAFESPDGKTLFYSNGLPGEIWKTPTTGGLEERVDEQLNNIGWGNWAITSKGIYFLRQVGSEGAYIGFYDFGLRRVIRVGSTNKPVDVGQSNLSVSPDGRWLLYSEIDQLVSDIMLVKNFR